MTTNQQPNMPLFLMGLLCMFLGVACFGFILYVTPYIFLDLQYDIPEFVFQLSSWYETHQDLSGTLLIAAVIFPFFLSGIIFFLIAKIVNTYLETHNEPGVPELNQEELEAHMQYDTYNELVAKPSGFKPTWLVVAVIIIILVLLLLGEYLVLIRLFD